MRPSRILFVSVFLNGCAACLDNSVPATAPTELDENVKWFWVNSTQLDDAALNDGAGKLATAGHADAWVMSLKGRTSQKLSASDLAAANITSELDPAETHGLLAVNMFDCTLPKLDKILADRDQFNLYAGVWDSNERTFTSDHDTYLAGSVATLSWDSTIKVSFPVGDQYTSLIKGTLRRVPAPAGSTRGPMLLARTWLDHPATFGSNSSSYFKQDYEIEIFWEQSAGKIFHAYGMWRDVKVGSFGLTLDDNGFTNLTLGNLISWDDKTAALCAKQ